MLLPRIFALILSLLSLAAAVLAWIGEAGGTVIVALLVAAACLAVVSPFDAPDPRRRTRVLIACLAYVGALAAAMALAHAAGARGSLMIALLLLAELGVGLTGWVLATRKRRRMPRSHRYYDN